MGVATVPAAAGGGIKSVQRGSAAGSGNVTITAVDITKSFVTVFGTTSSGTVAATGALSGGLNATSHTMVGMASVRTGGGGFCSAYRPPSASGTTSSNIGTSNMVNDGGWSQSINSNAANFASANITGGSNNLVSAVIQGYLSNSTTLVVSGACRWEVVEFN